MDQLEDGEKSHASLLLGAAVSRGFVVRSGKQGARRGGMGAVRIRETYLRGDRLLISMRDTLLGEEGGGGGGEGAGPSQRPTRTVGSEDSRWQEKREGQRRCRSYVCPTADFLQCYLELFDRPSFAACFQRGGGGGGGGGGAEEGRGCNLLLLHSELSKLTGATGALSMKQERRLAQIARALPGTLVFFDKFCPDLHGATTTAAAAAAAGPHVDGRTTSDGREGDVRHPSPPTSPPSKHLAFSSSSSSSSCFSCSSVLAACRWCSAELENASVFVLSDDDDGRTGDDDEDDDDKQHSRRAAVQGFSSDGDAHQAGTGVGEDVEGGSGTPRVVLSLRDFLGGFVWGEAGEELARRGDLLRRMHLANKAATSASSGASRGEGDTRASSPLSRPHPSKTQLEALVAGGEALKGRLDVFEHNPKEGLVVVGAGGGAGAEALEGWTDVAGRMKVLVVGREGMNRSIHGDTVVVTLLPRRRWRAATDRMRLTHAAGEEEDIPLGLESDSTGVGGGGDVDVDVDGDAPPGAMPTGFVVGVVEEGRRPYVVTIPPEETVGQGGSATVAAVPMDPRVPKIRIKTRQLAKISGQRLVVTVDGWDVGHMFPFGHYVTSLGPVGEVSSEAAALLVECRTSFHPFSFNALASLPLVPNPPKESQKPRDALTPPATLAQRERPEDGFGKAPRWQDSGWRVQESDVVGRRDLRGERVVSVDPPGCQDIDDAMHVTRKPNGKLEIGVHIADVTRFVAADGPLDREARARATTVYLVHRRIDMLPALLASDLCSLHAGQDRLSVSAVWEAEEDGEDIRLSKRADGSPVCWFGRTVIHSRASMTYDQAQMLVESGEIAKKRGHEEPPPGQAGRDVESSLQPGLAHDLRLLTRVASRTSRAERVKNGAIDLSQTGAELKFKIDPITGTPLAVAGKEDSEIHHTIAELMILANSAVAEKIQRTFPSSALVRVHASPDPSRLTAFEGVAARVGVDGNNNNNNKTLNSKGGGGGAKGLSECLASVEGGALQGEAGRSKAGLLKSLAVRAMSEAEYVSTGTLSDHQASGKGLEPESQGRFGHFGLGLSHYTHFTSPIRRYADIVVHRLLLASLGVCASTLPNPRHNHNPTPLHTSGDGYNAAHRGEEDGALPPSMAPSVMEMERAAVGKAEMDAAERRSGRAGAGDASFVTNPDGTRTYSKVSVSAPAITSDTATSCAPPPPGMEAFPDLANPALGGDGDDLLDALLGLDVSGATAAAVAPQPPPSTTAGEAEIGIDTHRTFSDVTGVTGAAGGAAGGAAAAGDDGDSLLDALLGLDVETPAVTTMEDDTGGAGYGNDGVPFGGDADAAWLTSAEAKEKAAKGSNKWEGGGGGEVGDLAVASPPPFEGAELGTLCTHLNERNRNAKRLAQRCQEMFLRLFFKDHSQVVQGLVLSLRSNGFIAYVPAFDAKGPVYISDKDGQVQVDPALLGLSASTGSQPSKAFATLPACRALPGASASLVSEPGPPANASRRGDTSAAGGGSGRQGEKGEEAVLEVRPPPGMGGKVLRLRALDGISLRLSCDVLPTQARLPKVRFLLAGVGNRPASRPGRTPPPPTTVNSSRPVTEGVRIELDPASKKPGGSAARLGEAPRRVGGGVGRGLYWLLQGARDDAICTANVYLAGHGGSGVPHGPAAVAAAAAPEGLAAAELAAESFARRMAKKERKSTKAGLSPTSPTQEQQRSEVGAGRALFGGFVPSRQAPAPSLYDFGSSNSKQEGGRGGGAGSTSGGGFTDVSSLASIYSQAGVVPGGAGGGAAGGAGGTLETLNDARVRQYTQEATTRAHRLGAEKRNSRISKSKRQG
ncbi:unnamed protein product [Pylaiella littoralis]